MNIYKNFELYIAPENQVMVDGKWYLIESYLEEHFDSVDLFQATDIDGKYFEFTVNDIEELEVI